MRRLLWRESASGCDSGAGVLAALAGGVEAKSSGEEGHRSLCLVVANDALYHLSYIPDWRTTPPVATWPSQPKTGTKSTRSATRQATGEHTSTSMTSCSCARVACTADDVADVHRCTKSCVSRDKRSETRQNERRVASQGNRTPAASLARMHSTTKLATLDWTSDTRPRATNRHSDRHVDSTRQASHWRRLVAARRVQVDTISSLCCFRAFS